jgi:hypothetical protein
LQVGAAPAGGRGEALRRRPQRSRRPRPCGSARATPQPRGLRVPQPRPEDVRHPEERCRRPAGREPAVLRRPTSPPHALFATACPSDASSHRADAGDSHALPPPTTSQRRAAAAARGWAAHRLAPMRRRSRSGTRRTRARAPRPRRTPDHRRPRLPERTAPLPPPPPRSSARAALISPARAARARARARSARARSARARSARARARAAVVVCEGGHRVGRGGCDGVDAERVGAADCLAVAVGRRNLRAGSRGGAAREGARQQGSSAGRVSSEAPRRSCISGQTAVSGRVGRRGGEWGGAWPEPEPPDNQLLATPRGAEVLRSTPPPLSDSLCDLPCDLLPSHWGSYLTENGRGVRHSGTHLEAVPPLGQLHQDLVRTRLNLLACRGEEGGRGSHAGGPTAWRVPAGRARGWARFAPCTTPVHRLR